MSSAMRDFAVLTPDEFRQMMKDGKQHEGTDAFVEFQSNCRALTLKANTALCKHATDIQSGAVVDLSKNYIGANGLQAMTTLVSKNKNLKELRTPNNGLNNDAVVFLCRSLKGHPTLRAIDMSGNTSLSLTGGMALLSLIQQNGSLVSVNVANTQIPEAVVKKIDAACEGNAARQMPPTRPMTGVNLAAVVNDSAADIPRIPPYKPLGVAAVADNANDTTKAKAKPVVLRSGVQRTASERDMVRREAWELKEKQLCAALAKRLHEEVDRELSFLPPAHPHTGWRLLEVAILAPPCIFDSEVHHLVHEVFPRLNLELQHRKVQLLPLVNGSEEAPGTYLRHLHFTVGCDIIADVKRSRFVAIELIGDRAGSYEQKSSTVMVPPHKKKALTAKSDANVPPQPVKLPNTLENNNTPAAATAAPITTSPDTIAAPPLHPVLYDAHEEALKTTRWVIVATRRNTKFMGVPPSLAPLLSAEPRIEHPDPYRPLVKKIAPPSTLRPPLVSSSSGASAQAVAASVALDRPLCRVDFDRAVEESKWKEHVGFRQHVVETLPVPELLIEDYSATFAGMGEKGEVFINGLEEFVEAVYARLHLLTTALFPIVAPVIPEEKVAPQANNARHAMRVLKVHELSEFMSAYAAKGLVKKTLTNRLNLYVATPPSRNAFILHGAEPSTLAANMAYTAAHLASMPYAYSVAAHSARSTLMVDEPTDLRCTMVSIITQLTSNPAVLRYLDVEVELERLQRFFIAFLSGSTGASSSGNVHAKAGKAAAVLGHYDPPVVTAASLVSLESGDVDTNTSRVFVVILEGLDLLEMPEQPCDALRVSEETGADMWGAATADDEESSDSKDRFKIPQKKHLTDFLPKCLARNVRVIATCHTNSDLLPVLSDRGRDSVEVLGLGTNSANDVEQMLNPARLQALGVTLSEDEYIMALDKEDARNPEYMRYMIDAMRRQGEAPGFESQTQAMEKFPGTLSAAVRSLYDHLRAAFGAPLIHKVLGIFTVSRWGVPEPLLRSLLKLSPQRFRELLRLLRPALSISRASLVGYEAGNNLMDYVRVTSPAFLALLRTLEAQEENPNVTAEDHKVWHNMVAHRLLTTINNVMLAVNEDSDWDISVMHPYERYSVKELPYHLAEAGLWQQFDRTVLSIPFMKMVYRNGLAYNFFRDLIHAFNRRYSQYLLGEDVAEMSTTQTNMTAYSNNSTTNTKLTLGSVSTQNQQQQMPQHKRAALVPSLMRLRDYIYFVRANSAMMTEHPHLVAQICMEKPSGSGFIQTDARTYLASIVASPEKDVATCSQTYFTVINPDRKKVHQGQLTNVKFTSPAKTLISGSIDRSLCWLDPASGTVTCHARHPTARVVEIFMSATSAYVGALSEDRSMYIYDTASCNMVSRNEGELFTSPILRVCFSPRGRYYYVATADLRVRVFDTEKSRLCMTLNAEDMLNVPEEAAEELHSHRNHLTVVPHPWEDEEFITIANTTLRHWRINDTRDWVNAVVGGEDNNANDNNTNTSSSHEPHGLELRTHVTAALWIGNVEDVLGVAPTMAEPQEGRTEQRSMAIKGRPCPHMLVQFHNGDLVLLDVLASTIVADFTTTTASSGRRGRLGSATSATSSGAAEAGHHNNNAPTTFALSADRTWLVVALQDGRVALYVVPWHSFSIATHAVQVRPCRVYTAFSATASPRVLRLMFNPQSNGFIAVGNVRQLKYWDVPNSATSAAVPEGGSRPPSPGTRSAASMVDDEVQCADGECVFEHELTCCAAVVKKSTDAAAADIAVGDITGQVTFLKMWRCVV